MKLAIGTAQFGLPYGVANHTGQVGLEAAKEILCFAKENGIDTIDTAIAYGASEKVLGKIGIIDFRIITKLPAFPSDTHDATYWVLHQVNQSFRRLNVGAVYGLLLHRPDDLLGASGRAIYSVLERLQHDGFIQKIGISIYDPEILSSILASYPIDIVQAPLNLIDRRLIHSGWLKKLHEKGIEIHTRSAFLQGLLLLQRSDIPPKFERWANIWDHWQLFRDEHHIDAVVACIQFPLSIPEVDRVVIGVDHVHHLRQIVDAVSIEVSYPTFRELVCHDELLIDPFNWDKL